MKALELNKKIEAAMWNLTATTDEMMEVHKNDVGVGVGGVTDFEIDAIREAARKVMIAWLTNET